MFFRKCDKDDGWFCPRFSKQMIAHWMVERWNVAFRIGSFDPCASCHLPIRSACIAWLRFVCGTCIQYIPYAERFSWLSLPMRKRNIKQNASSIRQWPHKITHKCFRLVKLPSFWRLVLSDHQNLVVYDRNDDVPGKPNVPSTFCIVSLCATCGTCIFCKKYDVVLVRSPENESNEQKLDKFVHQNEAFAFAIFFDHIWC